MCVNRLHATADCVVHSNTYWETGRMHAYPFFLPVHLCLGDQFLLECAEADCWNRVIPTPPRYQEHACYILFMLLCHVAFIFNLFALSNSESLYV